MKIVWCSNYSGQPTGYGVICNNVVPYIQHNSKHEMVEFAISGINRVLPFVNNGIKVYGSSNFGGKMGVGDWPAIQNLERPDMWMLNFDAWASERSIPKLGIKYAIYPPLDHDPLPPVWRDCLEGAIDIVPYCQFGERVLKNGLGISAPISHYIPHGVDTKHYFPMDVNRTEVFGRETSDDAFVIGIFKNNQGTRAKYNLQLEGVRKFINTVHDDSVRVYIHASAVGGNAPDLRELVRRYNLEGHVYMIAPDRYRYGISESEMAETYNACDIVLNCVAGEGWGLPITEAFACGVPVIGTAFSSMPEIISGVEGEIKKKVLDHGECYEVDRGWLVPTASSEFTLGKRSERRTINTDDIATALVKAYENPGKRKEMGARANKWVQKWDWDRVGDMWIDYFDKMAETVMPKKYSWTEKASEPIGNNKTACVVFSFNRPDYLVQTLDSLAKNTKADECDWFFYQDGWKNTGPYPYCTDEQEKVVAEQVQRCLEIIEGFPFAHKEIITREDNACIGVQCQEAKKRIFGVYDNVIFFDDDHVVSKDYIDTLLKLHEQYPDAIVGAQATERRNIPADATLSDVGIVTKSEGDAHAFPGRWRWLAYLMPKAVHEATVEHMDEYLKFIGPSYRNIPDNAVRAKYGVVVTGFDGVLDKFCDGLEIRRVATVIPRARYIGKYGTFGTEANFNAMGFPSWNRYEFDEPDTFRDYRAPAETYVKAHGHKFTPDASGRIQGADEWVTDAIKVNVKEGDTVIDVGACVGYYTILMSDIVGPTGKVYSFEPDPTNFAILEENVGDRKNVQLVNQAVSDHAGTEKLYLSKVNNGDHRLYPAYDEQDGVDVVVVCLDEWMPEGAILPSFIKIDAQGAEGAVLRGMKEIIANSPNMKMVIEYGPKMMEEYDGTSPWAFVDRLRDGGFMLIAARKHDSQFELHDLLTSYSTEDDRFTDLLLEKVDRLSTTSADEVYHEGFDIETHGIHL